METVASIAAIVAARILWSLLTTGTAKPCESHVGYYESSSFRARKQARFS